MIIIGDSFYQKIIVTGPDLLQLLQRDRIWLSWPNMHMTFFATAGSDVPSNGYGWWRDSAAIG